MRHNRHKQLPLNNQVPDDPFAKELQVVSAVLDDNHIIYELASQDLTNGRRNDTGRKGMTGEQVVRCAVLKCIYDSDYRELAFHLKDSSTAQWFSRLPYEANLNFRTLQKNIKRIQAPTWEKINQVLVRYARKEGIENGKKIRSDCTVVKSNIHRPTDSRLLEDCVRVLSRLMERALDHLPGCVFPYRNHERATKRRVMEIINASNDKKRRKAYRKLIGVCENVIFYAHDAIAVLRVYNSPDLMRVLEAQGLAEEIQEYIVAATGVVNQTWRRVINGETVPAREKIVSIFEPHTDIIVKDRRETLYGHKVCLTSGSSSIITDCVVEDGNPADSTLVLRCLERHRDLFGYYPRQATFDGGFASRPNLDAAKSLDGVEDVAFAKRRGLKVEDMTKSRWVYRNLRRFRAGVEGLISTLKRVCGLDVCMWKGHEGFKSYVLSGVVAFNLLAIARNFLG